MTKCIWARATTIYYCPLPPPACWLLSQGARKQSQSLQRLPVPCPSHLRRWGRTPSHLTEKESDQWKSDWGLSKNRCPRPSPTCQSWGEIHKPSSFQPLVEISFGVVSQDGSWYFCNSFPRMSKKKNQENTLARDREGNLRFWHSGNEHSWTGGYVRRKENVPFFLKPGLLSWEAGLRGCGALVLWLVSGPGSPSLVGTARNSGFHMWLPRWLSGKESAYNAGHAGTIPESISPGEGNGNLFQYSCLG